MFAVAIGFFFFVLPRSLNNCKSHRPTNAALFILLYDFREANFFIHTPIIFEQYLNF